MRGELRLRLDVAGLGQQFEVVAQLLADLELEAQCGRGAVVDEDRVLVQTIEHADLEVDRLSFHPHRNVDRVAQDRDRDLNSKTRVRTVTALS